MATPLSGNYVRNYLVLSTLRPISQSVKHTSYLLLFFVFLVLVITITALGN